MTKKLKKEYWTDIHEEAVLEYINPETTQKRKNYVFEYIINPALLDLIEGISQMQRFHSLYCITKEELKDIGYEKVILALDKFKPGRIGKNGYPVKAYSYYGTVAKNAMQFANKEAIKNNNYIVNDFDLSFYNKEDIESFNLQMYLDECKLKFEKINKFDLLPEEKYFMYELEKCIMNWNKIQFLKDKTGTEKLSQREFKSYLCSELEMNKIQFNNYYKRFQELLTLIDED